jgi:hypothetical protein
MSIKGKQISNPSSTGSLGVHFENRVQASFVVLMLSGGFTPCLPTWPIHKIKLQGKYQGFDTDDLIVYAKLLKGDRQAKLFGQIKHTVKLTNRDETFCEVIQAAWNDFNNKDIFTEGTDAIALITGPLSATDTNDGRALLRQAQNSEDAEDFIKRVDLGKFTSTKQREKLNVFKTQLKAANNNIDLTIDQLWRFLKSFHILIYDLDIKGVTLSLLHSLIGQYSPERVEDLLARIEKEVTFKVENAGCLTIDSIPVDVRLVFQRPVPETIPDELVKTPLSTVKLESFQPEWNNPHYGLKLAIANFLGSWNENSDRDIEIVSQMARATFPDWISLIREVLLLPESPITLLNGVWSVRKREELWQALGSRIFDINLDIFKECVLTVLTERDPKFSLPPNERFAANIYAKETKYSNSLRKGIAESLALLGSDSKVLNNCSLYKPETISVMSVREIFEHADWVIWGSLDQLLPLLAEAAPGEFTNAVETALQQTPCPFDELFAQEGSGIAGGNYLTGLLWALETLAWDEKFLVRVSVILGELASHDPGGNWANRPINSLTTIFLPWFPQTTASIEKRKVALQTLSTEVPQIAWKLLLSLLPNQHQTSMGSHKPTWRKLIPNDWTNKVSPKEYWEQVSIYSDMATELARGDTSKLNELIDYLDHLPRQSFEKVLEHLSSEKVSGKQESERLNIWIGLTKFILKHKKFADAEWALNPDMVKRIEEVCKPLAPKNPLNLNRILFSSSDSDLFEEKGNYQEQRLRFDKRRNKAIIDILKYGGTDAVLEFAMIVESPTLVGHSLGCNGESAIDLEILPDLLNSANNNLAQFVSAYVWSRQRSQGWEWADRLDLTGWTHAQIGQFLACLPFTEETWRRSNALLGNSEAEYWSRTPVYPYQLDGELGLAIEKLIEHSRPNAAINCLSSMIHNKLPLDKALSIKALLSAVSSSEPSYSRDVYDIIEVIKALQDDPCTNFDDLFHIEWAYLSLLERHNDASPITLENRLALDPDFFCQVIRLVYRSRKIDKTEKELSEQEKAIATNAWRLLHEWRSPPGLQPDGTFSGDQFNQWLTEIQQICSESGHLEVALTHIGNVLIHCPPDTKGLWIDRTAAEALNRKDSEKMRSGYRLGVVNSRGAHWVDPTGNPERELALKYRQQAEDVENDGYQRFAVTLRGIAESYDREAEQIVNEHKHEVE